MYGFRINRKPRLPLSSQHVAGYGIGGEQDTAVGSCG